MPFFIHILTFLILFIAFLFVFCPDNEASLSAHHVLLKENAYTIYRQITVCLKGHPCGFKRTLGFNPHAPQLFNTTQFIIVAGPKNFPNYKLIVAGIFQYCSQCTCAYFFFRFAKEEQCS